MFLHLKNSVNIYLSIALAAPVIFSGCGGGSGATSARPSGATPAATTGAGSDELITSRFGESPGQLAFARAVAVSAGKLLVASASTTMDAKQALVSYSVSVSCVSKSLTASETAGIQTDVISLVFNDSQKRAKLQHIYTKAGVFEIDAQEFTGTDTC